MSDQFAVNLEELDNIVSRISGLASFVADHLDEVDTKVAGLVGTGWEGVAAQAYSIAHQEWLTGAREFTEGLRTMSDAAKKAHGRYSAAAEVNRQMIQGG